jgi:hypothetical protein
VIICRAFSKSSVVPAVDAVRQCVSRRTYLG